MQIKILLKRMALMAVLSGLFLFTAIFLSFIPKNSTPADSTLLIKNVIAYSKQKPITVGLPTRLKIPVIQIDASVISVGLTADKAMDTPKGPDEVAWFNLGLRPGEIGTAVIAGHYGWKDNLPAVFDNLHKLRRGDKISVEDENGVINTFVVREIRIYDKDQAAPEVFYSNDGKSHLNLITCTGDWNKAEKTRSERLVVFTDKE